MTAAELAPLPPHPRDDDIYRPGYGLDALLDIDLTIRDLREALRCRNCGGEKYDPDTGESTTITGPCEHGCCTVDRCPDCGHYNTGAGPAGCPCSDGI